MQPRAIFRVVIWPCSSRPVLSIAAANSVPDRLWVMVGLCFDVRDENTGNKGDETSAELLRLDVSTFRRWSFGRRFFLEGSEIVRAFPISAS